jgi:hypothetical protein
MSKPSRYKLFDKYRVNPLFFMHPNSEAAYLLGLLWADGWIHKKTGRVGISCLASDMELLQLSGTIYIKIF